MDTAMFARRVERCAGQTAEADVEALARFDRIEGFKEEVGMIHSIAHFFRHFGISSRRRSRPAWCWPWAEVLTRTPRRLA